MEYMRIEITLWTNMVNYILLCKMYVRRKKNGVQIDYEQSSMSDRVYSFISLTVTCGPNTLVQTFQHPLIRRAADCHPSSNKSCVRTCVIIDGNV